MTVVIDTSALMALIKREPGADQVAERISGGLASAVIFAETLSKLATQGYDSRSIGADLLAAGLNVEPVGMDDVRGVVALNRLAQNNISLADRFCLALGLARNLPVLTGDRPWADLGLPLKIELIR